MKIKITKKIKSKIKIKSRIQGRSSVCLPPTESGLTPNLDLALNLLPNLNLHLTLSLFLPNSHLIRILFCSFPKLPLTPFAGTLYSDTLIFQSERPRAGGSSVALGKVRCQPADQVMRGAASRGN
jgi:hypothetical protein